MTVSDDGDGLAPDIDQRPEARRARPGRVRSVAVVMGLGVALAGGILLGWALTREASVPQPIVSASLDAGFARDMQTHHSQAVRMSVLLLDRSDDQEVRQLAKDILLTQQQQSGQMYGWLEQWGLPQSSSTPAMAWMSQTDASDGMGGMGGMHSTPADQPGEFVAMPGMASPQDLAALEASTGAEADRRYLQLMIPHHQGGVMMASAAQDTAATAEVRRLATTIVRAQTAELRVLESMLAARGGPLP